jgi:hypothetical protein
MEISKEGTLTVTLTEDELLTILPVVIETKRDYERMAGLGSEEVKKRLSMLRAMCKQLKEVGIL